MKPNLTNLKPTITTPNNQNEIKKVQEEVANLCSQSVEVGVDDAGEQADKQDGRDQPEGVAVGLSWLWKTLFHDCCVNFRTHQKRADGRCKEEVDYHYSQKDDA